MIFDKWQQDLIDYKGSVTVRAGRQVGKSTAIGKRRAKQMLDYPGTIALVIAPSQRQSAQLFMKVMHWLDIKNRQVLEKAGGFKANSKYSARMNAEKRRKFEYDKGIFNEIPTKTTIILKKDFSKPQSRQNQGSICYSLPAGKTGVYLRTYALDFLDIEEAAYVPEVVYNAVKPMLAVSAKERGFGWETFLSTPFGRGGFFYNSFDDEDFKQFHVSSENCSRISREFLKKEKKRLSRIEYAQEWLGEFIDEFQQFFPSKLIKERMTFMRWDFTDYKKDCKYFLGVDLARYGQDENAFVVAEMDKTGFMRVVSVETSDRISLDRTYNRILMKDEKYNFNRILIDDAGLGAGITDMLVAKLGRRVIGLNNASRSVDAEGKRKGRIFKEDLYSNASMMMERGAIDLINSMKLARSLKSMTFEYTSDKNIIIKGKYSHISEAFVRVCWAPKAKSLKLFVY